MNKIIPRRVNLIDEFFRDLTPGYLVKPLHGDALPEDIRMDVKQTEQGYEIEAELPGVSKDDIQVSIEDDLVTVRAEIRQRDEAREGERTLHSERYFGSVSRSLRMPGPIDVAQSSARFDAGLLKLSLPKKASATGRLLRID